MIMLMGKFQGVMAATTPTGCLMASMRRSFCTVAKMSPVTRRPSSANHSIEDALQSGSMQPQLQYSKALTDIERSCRHFLNTSCPMTVIPNVEQP